MSELVIAIYEPKAGKENELEALIAKHHPTLRELGLITSRPKLTVRSKSGAYLEIFEWVDVKAADMAHEHPAVAKIWEAMSMIADFKRLADLPEANQRFSHFIEVPKLSDSFK